MFKRKVLIFGRSIPLAAIVSLVLVVVVAIAAFLATLSHSFTGTADPGPQYRIDVEWNCNFPGLPGSVNNVNTALDGSMTAELSAATDDSILTCWADIENTGSIALDPQLIAIASPFDTYVQSSMTPAPGTAHAPAAVVTYTLTYTFVGMTPGADLGFIGGLTLE